MPYCVADDLKQAGYTWTTDDEPYITAICDTASKSIDAYCKQTFVANTGYQEYGTVRVKNGIFKLFPRNLTISSIGAMSFIPIGGYTPPYTIDHPFYYPDRAYIIASTTAPDGQYYVQVLYDFGYADGAYPDELVKAAVLTAQPYLDDYFLSQSSNVSMVKSIKQGELTIVRADTSQMPQNAIDILNGGNGGLGYVRVRACS